MVKVNVKVRNRRHKIKLGIHDHCNFARCVEVQ